MKQILLFFLLLSHFQSVAQSMKKNIEAIRTSETPKIDGLLEDLWLQALAAKDWTMIEPRNFEKEQSAQRSEVHFLYDDKALYIGAMFYDNAADSILHELSKRDEQNKNCDWFGIWLSPYNDAQNEFMFAVTAAGIQMDSRSSGDNTDFNWDAVWKSAVKIHNKGWSAEIEIPYSALRIPTTDIHTWGINMKREIRRYRSHYSWNPIDIKNSNYASQAGLLNGIKNIDAPLRLSFMPYLSSYLDHKSGETNTNINGGLDLKYGINESFTLDITLIPDFGQTVFDNEVLNISPFEVRYDENRSFFTEGTELFNKSNLFYSRRISDNPSISPILDNNEHISEQPSNVQLLNATKLSGRTSKGLGIGLFNAITEDTYATITDSLTGETRKAIVEPMANYNILVLDQILKNNSYITFTNTNVIRKGDARDANVEKIQIQLGSKDNSHTFYGDLSFSHIFENNEVQTGHASYLTFEKSSGQLRYAFSQNIESDTYDINDLGFLYNNNELSHSAYIAYYIFEPKGKLRKVNFEFEASRDMLYRPNRYINTELAFDTRVHLTNYFSTGVSIEQSIGNSYDYFEARESGWDNVFIKGPRTDLFWWNSTDYRKRFAGDLGFGYEATPQFNSESYHIRFSPRFRVNNHIFMTYVISHKAEYNNVGRLMNQEYSPLFDEDGGILFSQRDRNTTTNVYQVSYIANNKLSFALKLRHYWSRLKHQKPFRLDDGNITASNFNLNNDTETPLYDINFNTWNIDLNCVWRFAPGSELNLQWKNAIMSQNTDAYLSAQQNIKQLFEEDQGNSISLKLVYYLDYLYLTSK